MDHQTKVALRQDQFVDTTTHGLEWAREHRRWVALTAGIVAGFVVLAVLLGIVLHKRSVAAEAAFGAAMQTYEAPLANADQPAEPGVKTYASAAERAKDANKQFLDVANKYGWTKDGKTAQYFAGITYMEEGQTASAESTLKEVSNSWDKELASLGKFALADLYHQTGRDDQAVGLLNDLAAHPTDAVPYGTSQIQLAELYTDEGKTDQAHKIYAQLKDKDKDAKGLEGPAGAIASQKLNPAPAGRPQL